MDTFSDIYDLIRRNVGYPKFFYKHRHITYDFYLTINVSVVFILNCLCISLYKIHIYNNYYLMYYLIFTPIALVAF